MVGPIFNEMADGQISLKDGPKAAATPAPAAAAQQALDILKQNGLIDFKIEGDKLLTDRNLSFSNTGGYSYFGFEGMVWEHKDGTDVGEDQLAQEFVFLEPDSEQGLRGMNLRDCRQRKFIEHVVNDIRDDLPPEDTDSLTRLQDAIRRIECIPGLNDGGKMQVINTGTSTPWRIRMGNILRG